MPFLLGNVKLFCLAESHFLFRFSLLYLLLSVVLIFIRELGYNFVHHFFRHFSEHRKWLNRRTKSIRYYYRLQRRTSFYQFCFWLQRRLSFNQFWYWLKRFFQFFFAWFPRRLHKEGAYRLLVGL